MFPPISPRYLDVMLKLVRIAGDHVTEEVWHRVVQMVTNRTDVQDYAAKTCFEALLDPCCHPTMVDLGSYVIGEFGCLIANSPVSSPSTQLAVLQSHYSMVPVTTRVLILTTYVKLANVFPELKSAIREVSSGGFVLN